MAIAIAFAFAVAARSHIARFPTLSLIFLAISSHLTPPPGPLHALHQQTTYHRSMAAEEDRDERKRRKQAKKERKKVKSEEKAVKKRKRESSSSESIATNGSKHGSNGNHDAAGPTITRPRANSSMSHHSTTEDIITGRMGAPAKISDRMFANHGEDDLVEGCPYQVKKIRTLVSLAPSSLKDVQGNIRRLSCEDITRYVGGLGGILMAVRKVKFDRTASGAAGRVLNELPHVHFNVEAEVVVFCPEVGSRVSILFLAILLEFDSFLEPRLNPSCFPI